MTPDTKDEQDKAYDPAQETYDRKFNEIIAGAQTAKELDEREKAAGDSADDFRKWEDEMSGKGSGGGKPPTGNIDAAKSGEEEGPWKDNTSGKPARGEKLGALLKKGMTKKGPIGILAAILFGGGGALGFFGFTLMPVTIMEHFQNDLNDLNPSNQRKVIDLFGKKLGGNDMQKKLSVCNAMISIRCSLDTIPESLAKKLEEDGKFKLGDKTVKDGRVSFSSIESPDGIVATNVQELQAMLKNSAVAAAAFNAAYSIKNSIFLLGSFFKNALAKLNLTKNKKIEGDNKKAVDESYEQSTKGEKGTASTSAVKDNPGDDASEEAKRKAGEANAGANEIETEVNKAIAGGSKIKKLSLKLTNALAVPQLMCLTYNMATFISVARKTKQILRFAGFAMIFLTLASSIKANAATEAEVEKGMSVLAPGTYPAYVEDENGNLVPNPAIGQNALDAEAYKVVAYGDMINLTGIAMKFFVAGGIVGVIEKVLKWVNDNMGKENVKLACKVVNHTIATVISFLAAPVLSAVMYGITSLLPVDEWAASLVNLAIDAAAGVDLTNGVIGKDAGNVLFIGAAAIMGSASQRFGMKPGALAGIKKNMSDNSELLKEEIALKTHEASKTPFDIKNRYSFLGSLSYQLASFMPSLQSPIFSSIGKIMGAIPNSLNMMTKNANAAYSMPVQNYSETRFNQCKDDVYSTLPITPDMFCTIRYTPYQVDANKLAKEINPDNPASVQLAQSGVVNYVSAQTAVTYMQDTTKQANEDGTPVSGTHYDKFTKNCVERTDPIGSSSKPLEEQATGEDGRWEKGEACLDDTPQNLLASEYTGYKESMGVMENKGTTTQVVGDGDARSLAKQVANNGDIVLLSNNTKVSLENFANTGTATNVCGAPFTPDPALLKTMLTLTNKYKIYVNNIGFGEPNRDRDANLCDNGQHPKGAAIDINRIDIKGGASTGMGLTFSGAQVPIITAYANDWLVALAPGRGGVGQVGCGGFKVTPPPGATGINGNLHFTDECNHLHIDARTR